jgi:hypothetical protein
MKTKFTTVLGIVCMVLFAIQVSAQAPTISWPEWGAEHQVDVPPNTPILTFEEGDPNAPDPDDPTYAQDLDVQDLFYQEDDVYVYFKLVMNPNADVRRLLTDTDTYQGNQYIRLFFTVDPEPALDWEDSTGLTWGWYASGYDYIAQVFPVNAEFEAETGYQNMLQEHTQINNQWSYEQYRADTTKGVIVQWNDDYNVAQVAIEKHMLQNPQNLDDYELQVFFGVMITASAHLQDREWFATEYFQGPSKKGYMVPWTEAPVSVDEKDRAIPDGYRLAQNYPNPFNPSTTIEFAIPEATNILIEVYNILGQKVATVYEGHTNAGQYSVVFDARNLPSGVYVYTLRSGSFHKSKQMILIK